jgi:YHS domain-containing protein
MKRMKKNKIGDLIMNRSESVKFPTDPVCGMPINPDSAGIMATIGGQNFYFCAENCRRSFVENPKKYLEPKCDKPNGWWDRYMAKLNKATGGKPMKCH